MNATPKRSRGRPRDEALQERRTDEILDVAAKVFATHGYQHTEMQLVADEAEVGKGTLYRYFENKEALFLAAVDRGMQLLNTTVKKSHVDIADPLEAMMHGITAYLSFFKVNPQYVELLIQERAEFRDRKQSTYFQHREKNMDPWENVFLGLMEQGRVRRMPVSRIKDVICDLLYGTMFTNHFSGRHKPVREQAIDIIDIIFHGILTESERQNWIGWNH